MRSLNSPAVCGPAKVVGAGAHGEPEVRLLVLCAGDPESERAFSGSARSLILALERRGIVHHKANVLGYTDTFKRGSLPIRILRKLDRFGIEEAYRWSALAFARNTKRAHRIAKSNPGFNACLMYGTTFCPELSQPTYCYFDATAAQVNAARVWEFAAFKEVTAQAIIAYQKRVFDRCTAIFPRTEWAARSVRDDYGIAEKRVVVAGAGANYLAEPLPHGPYDTQTVLFVGIDFEIKGGPLVVEAFRKVREKLPQAKLVIVGCEPRIDEPGVVVVGKISKETPGGRERLLQLYGEASVFCMMSRFEAFGIVVIEAQNSGVPCVLPDSFSFPEMIRDHETGSLVNHYDANQLAEILTTLLGSPARLAAMGRAAHAFVQQRWTWDIAAERIHRRILIDMVPQYQG